MRAGDDATVLDKFPKRWHIAQAPSPETSEDVGSPLLISTRC